MIRILNSASQALPKPRRLFLRQSYPGRAMRAHVCQKQLTRRLPCRAAHAVIKAGTKFIQPPTTNPLNHHGIGTLKTGCRLNRRLSAIIAPMLVHPKRHCGRHHPMSRPQSFANAMAATGSRDVIALIMNPDQNRKVETAVLSPAMRIILS